jgi:hypothetical protein
MIAGSIEIQLLANMARLQKDMDDAKRAVGGAMDSIERAVGVAKTALVGLGAGLSIAGFVHYMQGAIDAADHLNDLSKSTGIAATELSGLKLLAQQSGGDLDGIAQSINKLSMNMGKDADKFAKIGVTAKDPIEAFKQLADVFVAIQDPQTRAAFGAEALGKSWASAAPALSEGGVKIGEMIERGKRLSGVTQEMVEQADKFNDQLAELKTISSGLGTKLAGEMLGPLNEITTAVKLAYEESGKLQALWVAMGAAGAFLFTDEFSSAKVKIANLQAEIDKLEENKKNLSGGGYLQQWLFGTAGDIDRDVASKQAQIAGLLKSMEKPAAKPGWTSGSDLPAGVSGFIGGDEASKKAAAAAKKEMAEQAKILEELSGLTGTFAEDWARLNRMYASGKLNLDQLTESQAKLLDKQSAVKKAHEEEEKVMKAVSDAYSKFYDDLTTGLQKLKDDTQAQQDQNDRLGLTKEAIAALDAAKLEEQATTLEGIAIKRLDRDLDEGVYNLYKSQAEELRKLAELKKEGATKETGLEKIKKDAEEAQKVLDNFRENVQRNLGDGLYDMLSGNFDNIGKSFLQMLLRMQADALAADITGAIFNKAPASGGSAGLWGGLMNLFGGMGGGGASATDYSTLGVGLASFDGGGFTGSGSRSGGIDGKGGFPAIMHPQESVIDHSRGQSSGDGSVSVAVHVDASGSKVEGDEPKASQLGQMIGNAVRVVLVQEMRPGGLLTT